jgi:RHS repeat-associated protein
MVAQTSPMATLYKYQDSNGTWQTITMNLSSYNVKTNFGCGLTEYTATGVNLPSSIYLPDGSHYSIYYEDTPGYSGYKTGRISQITLPQGGYYQYSYGSTNDGINCSDGTVVSLTRTVYDGTTTATWTYSRSYSSPNWVTTVTAPQLSYDSAANQSVYTFNSSGKILSEQIYQGSSGGTLLKTVSTSWSGNFPSEVDTTLGSVTSKVTYAFDSYGNPTQVAEYDWGAASPTRTTTLTYKTDTAYIDANLLSLMTQKIVHSGWYYGTPVSRMDITYDGATPTCATGVTGHDNVNFGCSFNTRGNATAVTVYATASGPSGPLTTNYSYDTLGNLLQTTDPANNSTTFDYGDNWYDSNCSVNGTKAYPKTVTNALSQVTTTQYNTCTGTPHAVTDANSQTTTYSYGSDSATSGRVSSVTPPSTPATNYAYSSTSVGSQMTFNSNFSTVHTVGFTDGLGRSHFTQQEPVPGSQYWNTVQSDYDVVGHVSRATLPFSATFSSTSSSAPGTTYQYDALGRPKQATDSAASPGPGTVSYTYTNNDVLITVGPAPSGENTKRRELEYDAMGRLKSVCEITSASGSGTCAQSSSQTGYWTQYTYDVLDNLTGVSQNSQGSPSQSRSYTYDGLSRMTQEVNPESGTTNYVFDSAGSSSCNGSGYSYPGDLVRKVDANGNNTCFYYDALHRLTDQGTSGPNSSSCKRFRYDNSSGVLGSRPSGVSISNSVGRLIEAETDTCAWPITQSSIITDEWFSYTSRGETSDVYQATPSTGTSYYHVAQSYWANGTPYQLSSSISGLPTITYGVNGMGDVGSTSASTVPYTLVSGVGYNTASLVTGITYGSSDSDSFTFDSNTNRLTQFQHSVNGSSLTGTVGWNANGTLGSLGIVDYLNSNNNQSCSYAYDDLSRLTGVNCPSVWAQTFTFDPFGNIAKSGSSSFAANYVSGSTNNNRITNLSSSYDSNGNLLGFSSDATWSLSWDWEGKPVSITGTGSTVVITYDALGRMVEQNRGGSYTQIVYSPAGGKLALMSGSSLQKAFVPLPAGAQAVYNGSGLAYYRHPDWLGTSRLSSTQGRTVYYDGGYAPYGETENSTEIGTPDRVFTGQNQDTQTGLYDFLFRQYHPVSGRWLRPDPAGLAATNLSNPQSLNRYAYVLNSPTIYTDPYGLNADGGWHFDCPFSAAWCYDVGWSFASTSWDGNQIGGSGVSPGAAEIQAAKNGYVYGVLASIYGDKNVATAANGTVITFHVSYLGPCGADALPDCLTRLTYALFQFLNPGETKSFSFEVPLPRVIAAFERSGISPSSVDNKYNPFHGDDFNMRDSKRLCSAHVALNTLSERVPGAPTTGTVHIDAINPLFSVAGHTIQDVLPYLIRQATHIPVPSGGSSCP